MSADPMAVFTRACIAALDAGDHFPGVPLVGGDGPTPIFEDLRTEFLPGHARPSRVLDWPDDDEYPPLAAWLPILGWLFFAALVCLLVWAWVS